MNRFVLHDVHIAGSTGHGLKIEAEPSGDEIVAGIVISGFPKVELNGELSLSGNGLDGLNIGPGALAVNRGVINAFNNRRHGVMISHDTHPLDKDIAQISSLIRLPVLKSLRNDLDSMLTQIKYETKNYRTNSYLSLSLLFAVNNFLMRAAQRMHACPEFAELQTIAKRRLSLARQQFNL